MSYYKGKIKLSNETVKEILEYPIKAIKERGLTQETCEVYGIRTGYSTTDREPVAHYFPHKRNGEVVGFIKRDLTKNKKERGAWTAIGDVSVRSELFGQGIGTDKRKVFIVEGMYDAPSAFQALNHSLKMWEKKNGKKTDIVPSVVSISLGTKNAKEQIGNNLSFVEKFDDVIIAFDNDRANEEEAKKGVVKGQDAVMEVSMLLPTMRNVILDHKDPNEYTVAGQEDALQKILSFGSYDYCPSTVVSGGGELDELLQPISEGLKVPELPHLMKKLKGFRPREFTVMLAPPKCGKTTLAKLINYSLLKQGHKVFGFYLEEDLKKTRQSFLAFHAGVPLPLFRVNPSIADMELVKEAHNTILDKDKALFFDDKVGKINLNMVMPTLEWAANQGAELIVLDHFQFIVANTAGDNERRMIDNLMNEVASFCKRTGVHVLGITHITYNKGYQRPKDKEGKVEYPHWYEVGEHDGRGSSAYAHVCSNLLAIDKEVTEDGSRGRTRLKVMLNREWDYTGIADILTMDSATGRLQSVE